MTDSSDRTDWGVQPTTTLDFSTASIDELQREEKHLMSVAVQLIEQAIEVQTQAHHLASSGQVDSTAYERCQKMFQELTAEHNEIYETFMRIHRVLESRHLLRS